MSARRVTTIAAIVMWTALPGDAAGQEPFEGWTRIHSDALYDTHVNPGSRAESPGDTDSLRVVRLIANKVLVRQLETERARIIALRRDEDRSTEGYEAYATTTRVLEIRCSTGRYSVWETTDFDSSGTVLSRSVLERSWIDVGRGNDAEAMTHIVDWACR